METLIFLKVGKLAKRLTQLAVIPRIIFQHVLFSERDGDCVQIVGTITTGVALGSAFRTNLSSTSTPTL